MDLMLALTPHGRLRLQETEDAPPLPDNLKQRLTEAFDRGAGHGLLQLGAAEPQTPMPAVFGYWRDFASRYVVAIRTLSSVPSEPPPLPEEFESLLSAPPIMTGAEYLTPSILKSLWLDLDAAFRSELARSQLSLEEFLKRKNPAWNLVGRVHFNLAENRKNNDAPFAFLATYPNRLTARAKPRHLALGAALTEYAGTANKPRLLSLLLPVQRAAEDCGWLKAMVDSGELFNPLQWTSAEAFQLLKDLPTLESAGVIVRVPAAWRNGRPSRPRVEVKVGGESPVGLGTEALLDFKMDVTLDGETLSNAEIVQLLSTSNGLHWVRGRWIEIDRDKFAGVLERFRTIEKAAAENGVTFAAAMRLLASHDSSAGPAGDAGEVQQWCEISAGGWLAHTLDQLRRPGQLAMVDPGKDLHAHLRPYQQTGVGWLHLLSSLGLGACLADDMGLGKTMQVLALLIILKTSRSGGPSILVAPASLLENWTTEIARFAPGLSVAVVHPSRMSAAEMHSLNARVLAAVDLAITSYGSLARIPELSQINWRIAIVDEAQAIKNPAAKQTRAVKQLRARAKIALTGTPVENRLGDLWSIFDFINPGLLGSSSEFTVFAKRLAQRPHNPYAPIRDLVGPYILRRLKTDRSVISDLPERPRSRRFASCHVSRLPCIRNP
jgi:non-specific serine/threonine protein kinase